MNGEWATVVLLRWFCLIFPGLSIYLSEGTKPGPATIAMYNLIIILMCCIWTIPAVTAAQDNTWSSALDVFSHDFKYTFLPGRYDLSLSLPEVSLLHLFCPMVSWSGRHSTEWLLACHSKCGNWHRDWCWSVPLISGAEECCTRQL